MPAAALGRWPGGSRAAGVMGKREVGPWGVDSPIQFHGRGSAGRGTAAMVVAGERRPWAAQAGVARGEWSWGKGRGRARAPTSALGLSREAAERASHGSRHGGRSGFAAAALL